MLHTNNARLTISGFAISVCQELAALLSRLYLKAIGGYKVTSHLRGQLGHSQRYVLAANHQSLFDAFAIFALLTWRHRFHILPLKFMTIPKVYHRWYAKPLLYLLGCFPAHNRDRDHHTYGVEGAVKIMSKGYNLCIFPEGTRTLREESNPKTGIVRILNAQPEAKLLLAHLEWHYHSFWRRSIQITVALAPDDLDKSDPKVVMDAIYAL